jgi:hypothetical protein
MGAYPQRVGGYFSLADALHATSWQEPRLRDALGVMASEGLLLVDDQPGAGGGRDEGVSGWRASRLCSC